MLDLPPSRLLAASGVARNDGLWPPPIDPARATLARAPSHRYVGPARVTRPSAFFVQVAPARSPAQPPQGYHRWVVGRGSGLEPWVYRSGNGLHGPATDAGRITAMA